MAMVSSLDLARLKTQIEAAMEELLRAADARVSWKQQEHSDGDDLTAVATVDANAEASSQATYTFLPGVYCSHGPQSAQGGKFSSPPALPTAAAAHGVAELNDGEVRVVLHGDNTFEYTWTMKRSGPHPMEFRVEMAGEWTKPVLNRSRRGADDQRVFLSVKKMRFQRLSNYDAETGAWKLCLKTLTRHGTDWTRVGETERGVPPIDVVLTCVGSGGLESTGVAIVSQVLSNSPACRVLAGLTKKVANKLGAPIDVMTDRWLPARHMVLARAPLSEQHGVRAFNPLFWYTSGDRHPCLDQPVNVASV
ncbi:hypothetical protein PybrP1_011765 [[Pythium] brassicae (nom. inval.)]|nr:hypothetical protein PybrP1_011765 [[Pythium] brassicae (nom. inval.)]